MPQRFKDIPQLTSIGSYAVDVSIEFIGTTLIKWYPNLNPDFQRGYVWTQNQKIAYVEYLLRGGTSGRDIYFNHPNWMTSYKGEMIIVDGKQRLDAVVLFLQNNIPAFGYTYDQYIDNIPSYISLKFHVNNLATRAEVLQWYIEMNSGGTVHTELELYRVKQLLELERK